MGMIQKGLLAAVCLVPLSAGAVDGVIEINHARALAGGVTPGDAPGYPVTINQPGSYRLTGNLDVPLETHGILVEANYVGLDLNGFTIQSAHCTLNRGAVGSVTGTERVCPTPHTTTSYGIRASDFAGVQISNGMVVGFAWGVLASHARIRNMAAYANLLGFRLSPWTQIEDSIAGYNRDSGFELAGLISHCTAVGNGVGINNARVVSHSSALDNLTLGMAGVERVVDSHLARNGINNNGVTLQSVRSISGSVLLPFGNLPQPGLNGALQLGPNVCGNALCP